MTKIARRKKGSGDERGFNAIIDLSLEPLQVGKLMKNHNAFTTRPIKVDRLR
jgi:hypothetical protein